MLLIQPVFGNAIQKGEDIGENIPVSVIQDSFYSVKIVSQEQLQNISSQAGIDDQILKIGPGILFGVLTQHNLYIRGDLSHDEYLVENRTGKNLKIDIANHLVDIAFGRDNANLSLLQSNLDYIFWFDASYTSDDINTSLTFARIFNNLSTTAQYEDENVMLGDLKNNYLTQPYKYYNIKLVPQQWLDEYKDKKYSSKIEQLVKDKTGKTIGFLSPTYLYLWNGLTPADRRYYITKSLYWSSGFHGESSAPDSFFYKSANNTATLSNLDKEAIKLLYGGRLTTGLTKDKVKKALSLS